MWETRLSDCRKPPSRGRTRNSTTSTTTTAVMVHLTSLRMRRRDRALWLSATHPLMLARSPPPKLPCWADAGRRRCPNLGGTGCGSAAAAKGVPLLAILTTVGVVVVVFLAGKLIYKLREIILLMVVAGFIALLLNPVVVLLQRWKIKRRGLRRGHRDDRRRDRLRRAGRPVRLPAGERPHPPDPQAARPTSSRSSTARAPSATCSRKLPRPALGGQEPGPQALDLRQEPVETGADAGQGGRQSRCSPCS